MKIEQFVKIDSHAHLSSDELFQSADAIIQRAKEAGVQKIININTDKKTFERGLKLKESYPDFIENTAATTPHDVNKLGEADFPLFESAAKQGQLIAIGETGLDYYYEHSDRDLQKKFLRRYLKLAKETSLPVIFHCRADEAFIDLFDIASEYLPFKAILHCFTGNREQALQCVKNGWYISMSGIVTFKRSDDLRAVLKQTPMTQIVIETDAPYLAPQSVRGRVNESCYVHEVLQTVSDCYELPVDVVAKQILENTVHALELKKIVR